MIDRQRLEAIVREAGRMAMALWPGAQGSGAGGRAGALEVWNKHDASPVSEADLAVDRFLKAELTALLPAAGWLSEEAVDNYPTRQGDLLWLVDPIDGTRDFIHGRAGWAVSVALVRGGRPLLGLLCAPARGELWLGEAGRGASRNGVALVASRRSALPGARVPAHHLPDSDSDLTAVDQPNSIALRIAMVGADEADLVATLRWGFEWDIAAAGLIAREAGAAVTDAFGQALIFNKRDPRAFGLLVSAPDIHAAAVARLAARAAKLG